MNGLWPPLPGGEFGPAAVRLAGLCGVQFGWLPDTFWRATPAEVAAVVGGLMPAGEAPLTARELALLETSDG